MSGRRANQVVAHFEQLLQAVVACITIGGKYLSKMHLPTSRVSLEAFVRLLITELGVIPRRENWETVLGETETLFLQYHRP